MAELDVTSSPGASGGAGQPQAATRTPALENGDRLTRCEFERRYAVRPEVKKAQLIARASSTCRCPSVSSTPKRTPRFRACSPCTAAFTAGVRVADNATVRLDLDNEPQPDVLLRIEPRAGGRCRVSDAYLEGAPELIVEVAASSASINLHDKLRAYRRNGVQEYVVWRTREQRIDWFELVDGD